MNFLKSSGYFIILLTLHLELVFFFSIGFYIFYFLNLLLVIYTLRNRFNSFPLITLLLHLITVLLIVNLEIYDETIFELQLWLNLLEKLPYISSEVMYTLIVIHILLFINLKKFESFWVIIDKKLFRN